MREEKRKVREEKRKVREDGERQKDGKELAKTGGERERGREVKIVGREGWGREIRDKQKEKNNNKMTS